MGQVIYYVAMSLDGFIADAKGGVDWLETIAADAPDLGYEAFFDTIGVVVMGATTYEQVLGFGDYPYAGVESIVMTSRSLPQPQGATVRFSSEPLAHIIADLKAHHEKHIWLIGGGKLAASAADAGLIDLYDLTIMPVLLRAGVPLLAYSTRTNLTHLVQQSQQSFANGIMRVQYTPRRTNDST